MDHPVQRRSMEFFAKKSQRGCGAPRFHQHAGVNIKFENNNQTAIRTVSFANAITFSEKPLAPGEIFLVEIEETETGWSGHMRVGLTQLSPETRFPLPLYALPDLLSMGPCWLYAITKRNTMIQLLEERYEGLGITGAIQNNMEFAMRRRGRRARESEDDDDDEDDAYGLPGNRGRVFVFENNPRIASLNRPGSPDVANPEELLDVDEQENALNRHQQLRFGTNVVLRRDGDKTWTPCGFVQHRVLAGQSVTQGDGAQLPTDVGSRIGVMFVPTGDNTANMHFIINGEDQGPCSRDIPYGDAPVYAVVDLYGSTKRIRTCQIYGVDTLQSLCRDTILHSIRLSGVRSLPLPKILKNYLLYHC